jgi:hypothetical protein
MPRSFSQIPVRTSFFLAFQTYIAPEQAGVIDSTDSAIVFPDARPESIVEVGSVTVNYVGFSQGDLLKDLGREVVLVDTAGVHQALYREVQRVNGATTEGVGGIVDPLDGPYGTFFVKVWSADGLGVKVLRTG